MQISFTPFMLGILNTMKDRKFYSKVMWMSIVLMSIGLRAQSSVNEATNYYQKGLAYQKAEIYDSAISAFTQAITLDSAMAEAWFQRGLAYDRKGEPKNARPDYEQSNTLKPNPVALNNMGQVAALEGDFIKAIEYYKAAIALDPNYAPGYLNLGSAYYDRADYKEACEMWTKAAGLNARIAIMANRYLEEYCK